MKVRDLIEMLGEYPKDLPLNIVYFHEDDPKRKTACDIHDCIAYGRYVDHISRPGDPLPKIFLAEDICLEIVGRNPKYR